MKHYLGICLVLVTVATIVLFAVHGCTQAVDHSVDHVRDAFKEVLSIQPQVTVNQQVVLTQTAPIAELAVVTKEELVTIGYNEHLELLSMEIPLTDKKLTAEATFRIKAGFDLTQPFTVTIDPATHDLHAAMPHAEITSVEQISNPVYHGESATLNRVTDADTSQIFSDLKSAARKTAESSGLKAEAEQQVTERLNEIMKHNGQKLQIEWQKESISPSQSP